MVAGSTPPRRRRDTSASRACASGPSASVPPSASTAGRAAAPGWRSPYPSAAGRAPVADQKIAVLIADDHAVVRAGLRALIEAQPDMAVVGEAADGPAAIEAFDRLHPDVML